MSYQNKPVMRARGGALLLGLALASAVTVPPAAAEDAPVLPRNSQTMQQVRSQFGEPAQQRPAIGQPPITRWEYPSYTVYFEFDRVLTAVPYSLVPPAALGERPAYARR